MQQAVSPVPTAAEARAEEASPQCDASATAGTEAAQAAADVQPSGVQQKPRTRRRKQPAQLPPIPKPPVWPPGPPSSDSKASPLYDLQKAFQVLRQAVAEDEVSSGSAMLAKVVH
jgi:hypothetical protein